MMGKGIFSKNDIQEMDTLPKGYIAQARANGLSTGWRKMPDMWNDEPEEVHQLLAKNAQL